ncbi:hypothetical protein chiPu_0005478 [Chiloscyllium punctatum]|uniref:Poly [ADP-ribose] polymerase n=1 Tax=Chiloscyllium punctatum TaxID=137246 RepID=A0A401S9H8_CHIPU|nr:hypothetical protein [Chiloscyllium punctatum]
MANEGGGFAILVTGFSHITKKGITTKLIAYFQSKKKSGGGECDVEIFENGNAVVTFQKRDAQKSVLERTHAITFDGQNIQLSVTQYSGELKNSQQDDHEVCSSVKNNSPCAPEVTTPPRIAQNESIEQNTLNDSPRICIKLKTEQFDHDHFSLFIECCSGTNCFQVLHTNETSVYIVEFMHNIDLNKALHTLNNKRFCGLQLVAKHLPRTKSLRITQLPELIREDFLALYFERFVKHDGYVELQMDESTQSAIITFPNSEVIEDILSKTHTIRGHTLKLHRYYKSENLTEFTTEQEREDSNPSNKDKEDLDSLTQKNEDDETKLASSFETEECQFKNKYHVLILKNQHLDKEFPHVQLHFDTSQNVVKITGMANEILKVQLKLLNKGNQITSKIIPLSRHLRVFLAQLNANGFLTQMFLDSGINAAYSFDDAEDKCILYAASETSLQKADQMLEMTFVELTVPIPENFDMDIANNFKFFIEKATTSVKREHLEFKNIKENYLLQHHMESKTSSDQSPCVTLVGYRAIAEEIKVHFKKYLNENCMKDCFIEVSSLGVFEYIQRFVNFSEILPGINIDYVNNEQLLGLQIRVNVKNATQTEALIMDVLKQVKSTKKQLDKPGAVQFFSKNKDVLKKLENPYQCIIFMENQEGQQTNSDIKKLEIITTVMFLNKFQISVIKHDLAIHECDVIVNTVSDAMDLSQGPVSKAILKQAGPELQINTNNAKGSTTFQAGDVLPVSTMNCGLHCQEVYNIICCHWSADKASQAEELLRTIIQKCLKNAHESHYKSMSFPAIGTGNLRFPKNTVAEMFFEEIKKFSAENPTSTLKRVKLIIYEKDLDLYSSFEDALLIAEGLPLNELLFYKEFRKAQKVPDSPPANMTREVETVSSLLLTNIGKITFELRCDGISKNGNILVVDYSEKKTGFDTISRGRVYYIKLRGQADFTKNLLKALQTCGNHQYDFLYIPIPKQQGSDFSTGSSSRDLRGFAASVIDSIYQYGDTPQATPIHVIVNDSSSDHVRVFQEMLSKHQAGRSGIFNTMTKYFGGWLIGNQTEDARDIQEHSVQPVKFQIYSMKEENIEEAWADIQKLATREHMEKTIPVEISFEMFTQEDYDEIEECCSKLHVAYQLDRAGHSISLSGCITDICSVQDVIFKVCHNIAKREVTLQEELFIMDKVCWKFWLDDHWETFNPTVNACLEKAYNEKENEVQVKIGGGDFCVIDFQKWTLTDSNATSYSIDRRCSGDELPDTWEIRGNDSTSFEVPVKPDSSEYQEIARDFQDSLGDIAFCQTFKIDAITRIQNLSLWRLYIAKRNEMNRLRPHQQNENILYHGTYSNVCSKINADGFNRSYCGLNAVVYGEGTYFAQHAKYSAQDTYSKPDATGSKLIYRARVLTGDYCKGRKDMKEPPLKDPQGNSRERYNSVTDKMESPEVFVVFQDNQAYPEYLITFHN